MNNHSNNSSSQATTGLTLQTVPVRIHSFLYKKVKQCVQMENETRPDDGSREMNMADFIRIATAERVGRILKEDVSEIPPVIRGRGGSLVAQAAKKAGISTKEFEAKAVELVAMQAMGYNPADLFAKIMSGEIQVPGGSGNGQQNQSKPKSGQHQIQQHQNGPGVRSDRRMG